VRLVLASHPEVAVILMDLSLRSAEDRLALTRWLREQASWRRVPIIATTAHTLAEDQRDAMKAGCTLFLSKLFSAQQLLEASALAQKRARS
jgi:CheY-like chemotaxis protein